MAHMLGYGVLRKHISLIIITTKMYVNVNVLFTFFVESIFKMEPKVEVMLALMWSIRLIKSFPYTVRSHLLVGTATGSGGSWQTTGKRLGLSTKSAHTSR